MIKKTQIMFYTLKRLYKWQSKKYIRHSKLEKYLKLKYKNIYLGHRLFKKEYLSLMWNRMECTLEILYKTYIQKKQKKVTTANDIWLELVNLIAHGFMDDYLRELVDGFFHEAGCFSCLKSCFCTLFCFYYCCGCLKVSSVEERRDRAKK